MPYTLQNPTYTLTGMTRCCIPRHGINPVKAPSYLKSGVAMPGGINMGLADGHVELAKLQNLWNYYWSAIWVVPSPSPP
jgi:prepilin-type processing-associated H-X9-DG protein